MMLDLKKLKELAEKAKADPNKSLAEDHPVTHWEVYLEEVYEPDTVLKLIQSIEVMREELEDLQDHGDYKQHESITLTLREVEKILGEKGEG